MKELKETIRRKSILYLIEQFLMKHGFKDSAEQLKKESSLSDDIIVCDNISLETIIIEYEIYYYQRFQTYPQFFKNIYDNNYMRMKNFKSVKMPTHQMHNNKNENKAVNLLDAVKQTGIENMKHPSAAKLENNSDSTSSSRKQYADIVEQDTHMRLVNINIKWDDIKGLTKEKEVLKEAVIYPFKYPHIFTGIIKPWKTILLYGPPGSGKTMLAKAAAAESQATFFNVSANSVISKWRGDSEKMIKAIFDVAQNYDRSIIFVDEIDGFLNKRNDREHEASRRLKTEFFTAVDNLFQSEKIILFLAATNTPWDLDDAILRRFEKQIFIGMPTFESRKLLFEEFLPRNIPVDKTTINTNLDYTFIAKITENLSGNDIKHVCKQIVINSLGEIFSELENEKSGKNKKSNKIITVEHVQRVLAEYKPTVSHLIDNYIKWQISCSKNSL